MPKRTLSDSDIDTIVQLYTLPDANGLWRSARTIGLQFSVSNVCILKYLRMRNIPIRTPPETQRGHTYRPIVNRPPPGETPPRCKCDCEQPVAWDRKHKRWFKYLQGHYRLHKPYHDQDWLETEYIVKERSANAIARECGVNYSVIYKFLRKFDIKRRTPGETTRLTGILCGPNHPQWKGGISEYPYNPDWPTIAKSVRDRDKWTCQLCGEQRERWGIHLHVHHIDEDKTNNHPHNLISLCCACHKPIHGDLSVRSQLIAIAIQNSSQ